MITLFWILTLLFIIIAITSFVFWLRGNVMTLVLSIGLVIFAYCLYYMLGSSHYLELYYSQKQKDNRAQRSRLQPLVTEVKKQEYKLRFYLDEHPKDVLAESQLLEILGLQALQQGNKPLAKQHFEEALKKLSFSSVKGSELENMTSSSMNGFERTKHLKELIKITESDGE